MQVALLGRAHCAPPAQSGRASARITLDTSSCAAGDTPPCRLSRRARHGARAPCPLAEQPLHCRRTPPRALQHSHPHSRLRPVQRTHHRV
jgi:hypothetical protein